MTDSDPEDLRSDPLAAARLEELEALRRSLADRAAEALALQRLLKTRQRELEQVRGGLTVRLTALRSQLERVQSSAAWRYGHLASRGLGRLRGRRLTTAGGVVAAISQVDRMLELIDGGSPHDSPSERSSKPSSSRGRQADRADLLLLGQEIRDRLGPPLPIAEPPSVALIVVSRSRERVARLLARVEETSYPALEVVLVDNASPGAEVSAIAGNAASFEIRTTRFENAASGAAARNKGAARAGSELVLFLGDEVHPVEPGWLHELVSSLRNSDAEILGPTIVESRLVSENAAPGIGWAVEQRGIAIHIDDGALAPSPQGEGEELFGDGFGVDRPTVAVSCDCLLISKAAFDGLGAFDTGYRKGLEDIDLCVRARQRGHTAACSGRAIVVDYSAGSEQTGGSRPDGAGRAAGRRRLQQLWGPLLTRDRLDGLLRGEPAWGIGPHLSIARTTDGASERDEDHATAQQLGVAVAGLGWRVSELVSSDENPTAIPNDVDVALVMNHEWDVRGFAASTLVCAWIGGQTEHWHTRPWFDRYDVLLASSQNTAERIVNVTGRPVEMFAPATDPARFRPPRPALRRASDWIFPADHADQPNLDAALVSHRSGGAVLGRGWEEVRRLRRIVREPLAYEQLPDLYAMSKLLIDNASERAVDSGGIDARVLDALACGTLVLTNAEHGARELFDDHFPTWSSAEQLDHQLGRLLAAPGMREQLASQYRQTVLDHHTYGHRARRLRHLAREQNDRLSFCLKIGAPDSEQAQSWGDLHLAIGLGRALRRLGHRWRIDVLPEWDHARSSSFDVAIHLRGRGEYQPVTGQFNVLWMISHPETFSPAHADGYDLVCVASEPFAASLDRRISAPVRVLEQATDPRVFFPDTDPALVRELVFAGNSRGVRRKILDDLLPTGHDLAVWGRGWEGTAAERHLQGQHLPNHELRKAYSSAAVVLCDHWPDMRAAGFRSNRLFDALACGALVVSDRVAGLDGSLGDAVLTYEHPAELAPLVERLLADPAERTRRTRAARDLILGGETFDHRARDLLTWVRAGIDAGGVPATEAAGA